MELSKKTIRNLFWVVVGCIFLYWFLNETERVKSVWTVIRNVASPFVIGSVLAFIINVPMRGFERLLIKISHALLRRVIALLLTFVAILLVLTLVVLLLIPQIGQTVEIFSQRLPAFYNRVQITVTEFFNDNPYIWEWMQKNTNLGSMDLPGIIQKAVDMVGDGVKAILSGAFSALGSLAGALVNVVIGIVFSVYCLFQKELLARQGRRLLYAFLPEKFSDGVVRILRLTNSTFSNFLSGQCLEVCILGVMFAISMAIFRMPYIPLVSVLVAVTAFIPVVGAFVGCIIGALFILVDNPMQAVWFVVMFLVIQQIENNVIYPRVVGTSIGLPGMWVLAAVAIGGEFMGVAGMFLMIPLAAVFYTLLREVVHKRLEIRNVNKEKLMEHPPELQSKFAEKREKKKKEKIAAAENEKKKK